LINLIHLSLVRKEYRLYKSLTEQAIDVLGLSKIFFWQPIKYTKFIAIDGIDLEICHGERVGIIGRNGAGKTTLLKLITGNFTPTSGKIEINGKVQALMQTGFGFHGEFTGVENIKSSLTYNGLVGDEFNAAVEDIIDFCELDDFIYQPVKTYSLGMVTRLQFAVATAIKPEIVIVDEILGAGDAYFAGKCLERMRRLTKDRDTTILFVSHDLNSVQRMCDKTIWIDRGQIVEYGDSLKIVKNYTKYIQDLEDRRLKAKNLKKTSSYYSFSQLEGYADTIIVNLKIKSEVPVDVFCNISDIVLRKDGNIEDTLKVGGPQDSDMSQSSSIILENSQWSEPKVLNQKPCRSLIAEQVGIAHGKFKFSLYKYYESSNYTLEISYLVDSEAEIEAEITINNYTIEHVVKLKKTYSQNWLNAIFQINKNMTVEFKKNNRLNNSDICATENNNQLNVSDCHPYVSRWKSKAPGNLTIENVQIIDNNHNNKTIFENNSTLKLFVCAKALKRGIYKVIPCAVLFTIDGILVSNNTEKHKHFKLHLEKDQRVIFTLTYDPLNLGNGEYVFSVALYQNIDDYDTSNYYDLHDRSYHFKVVGNDSFNNGLFKHPGYWNINTK
jgi:lipopolysaccharide transport system ATP-binding protein